MSESAAPRAETVEEVASPCTKVCEMDAASGLCRGCFRTLDEIAAWGSLDANGKRSVLASLPSRRSRHLPR